MKTNLNFQIGKKALIGKKKSILNVGHISAFELSYLVINPYSILQEPVLLLLHPVCFKWLLTDFTRLQNEEKQNRCLTVFKC